MDGEGEGERERGVAAMPAGANAYLFATKVDRAIHSASGAVALGTLLALFTVSGLVALLPR